MKAPVTATPCLSEGTNKELPGTLSCGETYSNSKKPFKAEVTGSDKRFCFCLPPQGNSRKMAVYESAIEAMAHLTLEGTADKHRLSLGGIYAPREGSQARPFKKPLALESFLGRHPEIEEIEICLNNDFAGRWAAEHLGKSLSGQIPHGEEPAGTGGF